MTAHGWQKLSGGLGKFMGYLSNMGIPGWMAYLVVAAEFGGGILVLVGLLTRLGALSIFIDMTVAITKVHWKNGLKGPGGFEFPLACWVIAFALIFLGAGPISLDGAFFRGGGSSPARK